MRRLSSAIELANDAAPLRLLNLAPTATIARRMTSGTYTGLNVGW